VKNAVGQGGPTFFFPWAKNGFLIGFKSQETPPHTIFENSQFLLTLTIFTQK
jgi:hypothetical protein